MKVRLPFVIQDQLRANDDGPQAITAFDWDSTKHQAEHFLDGPISTRVAVLDFREDTGALSDPVVLDRTGARHEYDVARDIDDRAFNKVSLFAIVHRVLNMYESKDVLGRRVRWAFDGPQLLVVPRAGTWKNAYYERETRSLQFFSFAGDETHPVIHTSLSLDIVSHETGHAVLDAIAPHLYDCITTQSLALHEAVGDLTTLFMTLDINPLRLELLKGTGGNIEGLNAYTEVAEAFGFYTGRDGALRTLWNDETLDGLPNKNDFHDMSQVLTGAVYKMLVAVYKERWAEASDDPDNPDFSESGLALVNATNLVRRLALRGLDYLPPGEISFADYGRSVIAADAVSNPGNPGYREQFAAILAPRIGVDAADLAFRPPPADELEPVDVDALESSDWHAYQLVGANRSLFCVPDGVPFQVEPRLAVEKTTYRSGGKPADYQELILKVSWEKLEETGRRRRKRWVRFGTTVAFDAETGTMTARVTTNPDITTEDHSAERERFLEHLIENDYVSTAVDSAEVAGVRDGGAIRLTGTGRCLHVAGADEPPSRVPIVAATQPPQQPAEPAHA